MGHKIYDLNDITESRIMMEHKLAPFTILFIYGLIFIVVIALIWASIGEMDIVVKARGIVRPKETEATVVSTASGKVKAIHAANFQLVKKGELLISLDDLELQLQLDSLKVEREQINDSLDMAKRFITGIEEKKNPFDKKLEEAYYLQFEKYKLDNLIDNQSMVLEKDKLERTSKELQELQQLSEWVGGTKIPKKDDTSNAASKYKQYLLKRNELLSKYDTAKKQFENMKELYDSGSISKLELDNSENLMLDAKALLEQYETSYINDLSDKIDTLKATEKELGSYSSKSRPDVGMENQISWENIKIDLTKKLELLDKKIELVEHERNNCQIKASTDGIYNPTLNLAIDDMVVEGTKMGTIVSGDSETYNTEINLGNYDIGRVNIGDKVKFKIDALPYMEYGFIVGEVSSISPDSTIDPNTGISYYKVMAKIKNTPIKSYKGIEKSIKVGMTFEAHIVADRKKVLRFILEKLQIWV